MSKTVFDKQFERRNLWRFAICLAAGLILSQCWPLPSYSVRAAVGIGGLAVGYFAAALLESFAIRYRRCPRCGAPIGRPTSELDRSERLILPCAQCQINWDLGIANPRRDEEENGGDGI